MTHFVAEGADCPNKAREAGVMSSRGRRGDDRDRGGGGRRGGRGDRDFDRGEQVGLVALNCIKCFIFMSSSKFLMPN